MNPFIDVRPVILTGTILYDGVATTVSATMSPPVAWGIFCSVSDGTITRIASDRRSAITMAHEAAVELGGMVLSIAPESAADELLARFQAERATDGGAVQ